MLERKEQDRRVTKTKRGIRMAFAKLLAEKELNDITIRDIAELADINRKTFYNHYAGIYAIVDEIENDIVSELERVLGEVDFKRDMEDPYPIFEKLTAIINTDLDFYGSVLEENEGLLSKIVELLKSKTKQALVEQLALEERHVDVILDYSISGMLAVYRNWFHSDRQQSIEEISAIIQELCVNGFSGLVAKEQA